VKGEGVGGNVKKVIPNEGRKVESWVVKGGGNLSKGEKENPLYPP